MEIDLDAAPVPTEEIRSQVCIVGAGIAGLTLAERLGRQGIDVVLLEAGGSSLDAAGEAMFAAAKLKGQPHLGTKNGRFRVYGGSSLRWGGQLLRLPSVHDAGCPIPNEELVPFIAEAERLLGVDALPYDAAGFFAAARMDAPPLIAALPELEASLSKWIPFSRRNLASTVGRDLLASLHVRVYLHAQVTELLLPEPGTRIEAALVKTTAGTVLRFRAEHFVLAAGTVETSRLLLASRSVAVEGVGNAHGQVGRNFHDHLTLPIATIHGAARVRMLRDLRPWVLGGVVHSVKFEASPALRQRLALNPVLAHMVIEEPEDSGVAVVRELLTALQRGGIWKALETHAAQAPDAALQAVRLAAEARLQRRRFVSAQAEVRLQLNVAQDAPSDSRVTLAPEVDRSGVPQALVDWRISAREEATVRTFAAYLKERFAELGLTELHWLPELSAGPLRDIEDARHAMGGACMGTDPRSSVVDTDLTVHGVPNLSIASAATFPTGSAQLPTLPLMALSLRVAERLAGLLGAGRVAQVGS